MSNANETVCNKCGYSDHGTGDFTHYCATQGTIANDPSVLNADERNKFEGWYRAKYWDFKYGGEEYAPYDAESNMYHHLDVQLAWDTWQTASEHSVKPSAQPSAEAMPVAHVLAIDQMNCTAHIRFIPVQNGHCPFDIHSSLYTTPPTVDQDVVKDAQRLRKLIDGGILFAQPQGYDTQIGLRKIGDELAFFVNDIETSDVRLAIDAIANHPASTDQSIEGE